MTVSELPGLLALLSLGLFTLASLCFAAAGLTLLARTLHRALRPYYAADRNARRALTNACCERWWTSLGTDHDPRHCTRKDTTR